MKMSLKNISSVVLSLFLTLCLGVSYSDNFLEREDVEAYLDEVTVKHGFSRTDLELVLSDHQPNQRIIDLISRPSEKRLEWYEYKKILVDKARINLCLLYTSPSPRDRTRSRMPSSA